jgi:tetratricopeptide (TPR) repeat protein
VVRSRRSRRGRGRCRVRRRRVGSRAGADDGPGVGERCGLGGLGRVRLEQKRYPDAGQYYQQALPLARRAGDRRPEAVVECNLSQINAHQGRYEQALEHAERELALRRHAGDHVGEAYALGDEAVARQGLGEHAAAIELTDQAMEMYRTLAGTENLRARVLETAAISFEQIGDVALAATRLTEACVLLEEIDAPRADALRDRAHTLTTPAADPDTA